MRPRTVLTALGALIGAGTAAYARGVRPWLLQWGATDDERATPLPGDDRVAHPRVVTTRAVTIDAPVGEVWPWLVQMGQGRAGLYSYDVVENLIGCDVHSESRVVPALQQLSVGDKIRLTPETFAVPLAYTVVELEPPATLVLGVDEHPAAVLARGFPYSSWAFVLRPEGELGTRLLVRFRADYPPTFTGRLVNQWLLEPVAFTMERKMLLGIKRRVEGHHRLHELLHSPAA
jgi:hypothetical protein